MRILFILLLLSPALSLAKDWYAGLSVGRSFRANNTTVGAEGTINKQSEQARLYGQGFFSGSVFIGQTLPFSSIGTGFVEGFYAFNGESGEAKVLNGRVADMKVKIKRDKTFGMNLGLSRPIGNGIEAFVKAGIVMSQFNTSLEDTTPFQLYSGKDSQYVWGFAPGLGIQSSFGDYRVGFSYSYYMYQQFTAKTIDVPSQTTYSNKMTPRYHVVELSVARKF